MTIERYKVDESGTPELIQCLSYCYGDMTINVTFFNGKRMIFCVEHLCGSIGIKQRRPNQMQWLEIRNSIERMAKSQWKKWFPYLKSVK